MSLPIRTILWAGNDSNHRDHLHVEGLPMQTGNPPHSNPGMTDSVEEIYGALMQKFGRPAYMSGGDWTHMGWYNRRKIAGTAIWSQHSWANALDVGPYYGVEEQQKFYDFLTGKEDDMAFSDHEESILKQLVAALDEVSSNGTAVKYMVQHLRNHPSGGGGLTETQARSIARDEIGNSRNIPG